MARFHPFIPNLEPGIIHEDDRDKFKQFSKNFNYHLKTRSSVLHTIKCSKLRSTKRHALLSRQISVLQFIFIAIETLLLCNLAIIFASTSSIYRARMVRLCIASIDPVKLSSQCVMCNRREFPLTVIDCTGISKMNDLIASPLSVQDATCLIYNCRRQVPDIKPEPYHGTAAVRANYPSASGIRSYEMMPPLSMYGNYPGSHSLSRYASYGGSIQSGIPITASGSNIMGSRQQLLPYTFVPSSYATPFGKSSSLDY